MNKNAKPHTDHPAAEVRRWTGDRTRPRTNTEIFAGHVVFFPGGHGPGEEPGSMKVCFDSDWRSEILPQDVALELLEQGSSFFAEAAAISIAETGSYTAHVWVTPRGSIDLVSIFDCYPDCKKAPVTRAFYPDIPWAS